MALSQIEKLRVVREAKRVASTRKESLRQGIDGIKASLDLVADAALRTQVENLFAATLAELDATITRCTNALAAIVVTPADRTAHATAEETEYRTIP